MFFLEVNCVAHFYLFLIFEKKIYLSSTIKYFYHIYPPFIFIKKMGGIMRDDNFILKEKKRDFPFFYLLSFLSFAAFMNDLNNGCALFGLDLNSGWN